MLTCTVGDMKRNIEKIKKVFTELDSGKEAKFQIAVKLANHMDLDAPLYKWLFKKSAIQALSGPMIQEIHQERPTIQIL